MKNKYIETYQYDRGIQKTLYSKRGLAHVDVTLNVYPEG
jgi:hypothetical protein